MFAYLVIEKLEGRVARLLGLEQDFHLRVLVAEKLGRLKMLAVITKKNSKKKKLSCFNNKQLNVGNDFKYTISIFHQSS